MVRIYKFMRRYIYLLFYLELSGNIVIFVVRNLTYDGCVDRC